MPNYTLQNGTLKNLLGATEGDELEKFEAGYVAARAIELDAGGGPRATFDESHLRALHHHLFQDVYEWAGRMRHESVTLSDGTVATMPTMAKIGGADFSIGPQVGRDVDQLMNDLHRTNLLRGLDREEFANRAAEFFGRLNSVHPFREGNGRTQRAFLAALADNAGHPLAFEAVSRERMIVASIASHEQRDYAPMQRLFREIADPERVQALREAQTFLSRNGFDWNNVYMATTEPQQAYNGLLVGVNRENFMMRDDKNILIGWTRDLPRPVPDSGASIEFEAGRDRKQEVRGPSYGLE
jgi:cell filamentation protein